MNIYYTSLVAAGLLAFFGFTVRSQDHESYTADGHIPDTELREFFNVSLDGNLSPFAIDRNSTENFYYEHYKNCQQCKEKVLEMNSYWHDKYDYDDRSTGNHYTNPVKGTLHHHRGGL